MIATEQLPTPVVKAHPFELAGMGTGPYRFLFAWQFPPRSLGEANPSAYQAALADMPRGLSGGCGTCRNCGRPITLVCVVSDAQGTRYGVGSDCVARTGDKFLGNAAAVAVAKIQRDQRRAAQEAKRAARQEAWYAANKDRLEAEALAAAAERSTRISSVMAKWAIALPVLDGGGDWCQQIAQQIREGWPPQGRAVDIVLDVYGKARGRRNSAAYSEAVDKLGESIGGAK